MKATAMVAASAVALGLAATAMADDWTRTETIVFPQLVLSGAAGGGQEIFFDYPFNPENDQLIVGWSAVVSLLTESNGATYASDLLMTFHFSNEPNTYQVGGFSSLPSSNAEWDFQGSGSSPLGTYVDTTHTRVWSDSPIPKGKLTGFSFKNDWNFAQTAAWSVELTLHKVIPAPGAIALLGLVGCVSRRRRA